MASDLDRWAASSDGKAGDDLLRDLAAYPMRAVHMSKHRVRSRIVEIHRDHLGRVLGSTERIEESEYEDLDGNWAD